MRKLSNILSQEPQLKAFQASGKQRRKSVSMQCVFLGSDRSCNAYWQFMSGTLDDPGCRRVYFESSEDGHWEVIDNEEVSSCISNMSLFCFFVIPYFHVAFSINNMYIPLYAFHK